MSIIFGVFYKNNKPVAGELAKMYEGMKHFPHERYAFAAKGNCGFGHMLTYNTPEALNESMPKWIAEAGLLFTAEGRIDNREELFGLLNIHASDRAAIPDGDLILKAYLKWGEECPGKLLGKWSLAAFHTKEQKLFLARDKWDYTNIEYYIDDKVFSFAPTGKGLFPLPFIKKEIDELQIARLLAIWAGDLDKTYYKGIKHLPASNSMLVTPQTIKLNRYWNYENIPIRRNLKFEDHIESLLENLNKAVSARLRSYKPIAGTLSGGLDSSTVCVLAAEQMAQHGKRLTTYSHVPQFTPSELIASCCFGDEKPFIRAIVEASGNIDPVYLTSEEILPIEGIRQITGFLDAPIHGAGNGYWLVDIFKSAMQQNFGTLLKGEFGNATTSWQGFFSTLPANEIFHRYGLKTVIKEKILRPMLFGNTPIASIYKQIAFSKEPWKNHSFCSPEFEKSLNLAEKIKQSGFDATFKYYFPDPKQNAILILNLGVQRLSFGARIGNHIGLEMRDPLGDPRVIESTLSIPNEMYLGKMDKWVIRSMMKGRLPDSVRLNAKKGRQSADLPERLLAHSQQMDNIIKEIENSTYSKFFNMNKVHTVWQGTKDSSSNIKFTDIGGLMRVIAAYEFLKLSS